MAQTGYTPISIYYSSTAAATPTAGNLVPGELAINTADGKLFYKDSAGVVQVIGTKGGVGSSTTTQVLYNSSGLVVGSANLTFNGTTLTVANDASISGLTVGKGAGSDSGSTVLGSGALAGSNTGANNLAVGKNSLAVNTSGAQSTALGYATLNANTTGADNVAVGHIALYGNTTGSSNVAVGRQALQANTTASNNTAVGYQAGYSNSTGGANTYLGQQAGYTTTSNYNTCLGFQAGYSASSGGSNTFIGRNAGYNISTGSKNTILGQYDGNQGGLDIRTASNRIVLSDGDGNPQLSHGGTSYDWAIPNTVAYGHFTSTGSYVGTLRCSGTNNIVVRSATNADAVYIASGATSWTSSSDEKLKENLIPIENGLEKVCSLRSVTGNFIADKNKTSKAFLIAQDVQAVLPQAISNDEAGYLGVAYTDTIPLLVAAIKELKAEIDSLKQQLGK